MKEINNSDIGLIIGFYDDKNILQIASIYEVMDDYIVTDLNERIAKKDIVDVGFVDLNKYKQLEERVKELESDKHIKEIKAQGIDEAIKKADSETYIGIVGQEFPPQKQYKAELLCYAEQLKAKHE